MPIPSRSEYERLVYGLAEHPEVETSTLRLYSTSTLTAIVEGDITSPSLVIEDGVKLNGKVNMNPDLSASTSFSEDKNINKTRNSGMGTQTTTNAR